MESTITNLNRAERWTVSQTMREAQEQMGDHTKRSARSLLRTRHARFEPSAMRGKREGGLLEISLKSQSPKLAIAVNNYCNDVRSIVGRNSLKSQRIHLCVGN